MDLKDTIALYEAVAVDLRKAPEDNYVTIAYHHGISTSYVVTIARHYGIVRKVGRKRKAEPKAEV